MAVETRENQLGVTTMETTRELADRARELSADLFGTGCSQPAGNLSCVSAEQDRPLTRQENPHNYTFRPFGMCDPDRLCASCRAYWFAEMAAQTLHRIACVERRRVAAETAAKEGGQ